MENYSLSDLKSAVGGDGFNGNSAWVLILLFLIIFGGNGNGYGRGNDAVNNEILSGQKFQGLDNKIDRIGGGIADSSFAIVNSIKDGNATVAGRVIDEGRALQTQISQGFCSTKEAIHAEGEATRALIQQNKIDAMQSRINNLEMQNAMCGVVRYPQATTYSSGTNPFCGCSCSNI